MDSQLYSEKQKQKLEEHEALCHHCGACCGALDGDPCLNLIKSADNKYFCKDYANRSNQQQKTISGKNFSCVPIRDYLRYNPPYGNCGYIWRSK